ncbi:homoserine O-succinyltransferase [Nocardia sp. NPDC051030]|uniref:homoserine O-acetyltransferase/O-succinyltransferase family protein n=1 Tax=Nocardia sp. NPDC051030 TaxID=3155162 RepID=UPI00342EF873
MMVVRVGIVDLISTRPDSMTRRVFLEAIAGAAAHVGTAGSAHSGTARSAHFGTAGSAHLSTAGSAHLSTVGGEFQSPVVLTEFPMENPVLVESTVFGIDPMGPTDAVDWPSLASMDALIISGSEPKAAEIALEPSLIIIDRILRECAAATSLLFSCQSAHAALHLLHGLPRHRRPRRQHGVFTHEAHANELTAGITGPALVPHSRWNAMLSADLRAADVPILLDSSEAEWHLATSPDGLRHVYLQGHPEYLPDTMAREYRRDLRRWIADPTLPFPDIPLGYFPTPTYQRLLAHAELVRTHRNPALLDDLVLPATHTDVALDWSQHSQLFFANWLRAVHDRCQAKTLLPA